MITKPTLLLDTEKCQRNIRKMALKAKRNNLLFRPHFKTHQSLEIGEWFKAYGVSCITVSSLEMAKYFSGAWNDITVAFPVNILEIDTINQLSGKITLNLLAESIESIHFLKSHCKNKTGVFLKIDTGYHRTGIEPDNKALIKEMLTALKHSDNLIFKGFLTHSGQTYACRKRDEIIRIHLQATEILTRLKNEVRDEFPDCIVSVGDTPDCSVAENFEGIDEIRPGNFVFYDLMQEQIGSCSIDEIAVAMACPIVAIHKDEGRIVIYGGGVHFSKEYLQDERLGKIFGRVVKHDGLRWTELIPDMYLSSLSQEHGIVSVPEQEISKYRIGDYLVILPVHSCLTASAMRQYLTTENRVITRL